MLYEVQRRNTNRFNQTNQAEKLLQAVAIATDRDFTKWFGSMKELSEGIQTASEGKEIKLKKDFEKQDDDDPNDRITLASDFQTHGCGLLVNRILTERENFGSKILIWENCWGYFETIFSSKHESVAKSTKENLIKAEF